MVLRAAHSCVLALLLAGAACEDAASPDSCCPQIFLSSSGVLADLQSLALGIYTIASQRVANNPRPVYVKLGENESHHVYYRNEAEGPLGWIVGGQLLEDSFYITTGQENTSCPDGIVGGFDRDSKTTFDSKFSIECHTDQVKIPCCPLLEVSASGDIAANNGGVLGKYKQIGEYNGHPHYQGGHLNGHLFYRKAGSGPDGWVISPQLDENMLMVTTRDKGFCPDSIQFGYDRDIGKDTTFTLMCTVEEEKLQDPGLPSAPLNITSTTTTHRTANHTEPLHNQERGSVAERSVLVNSAAHSSHAGLLTFRILLVIYIYLAQP